MGTKGCHARLSALQPESPSFKVEVCPGIYRSLLNEYIASLSAMPPQQSSLRGQQRTGVLPTSKRELVRAAAQLGAVQGERGQGEERGGGGAGGSPRGP